MLLLRKPCWKEEFVFEEQGLLRNINKVYYRHSRQPGQDNCAV